MSRLRSRRCAGAGGRGLRVVVDTNVWVSGLILPDSLPGRVLETVRERRIEPVTSWELAEELVEVLARPRLYGISSSDVDALLEALRPFLPTVDVDAPIRDPADAPVVAAAVAGRAEAIVSGDRDLLDDAAVMAWLAGRDVVILRPRELLGRLERR